MTPPAANSGETQASPEHMNNGMPGALQHATWDSPSLTQVLLGMRTVPQSPNKPVTVSTFADAIKPFTAANLKAAALGARNLPDVASWAGATRIADTASALSGFAGGVRWDLVNGAVGSAPSPQPAAATKLAKKARTIAEFGDALAKLRHETGKSLNDLVTDIGTGNQDKTSNAWLSKTALSSACQGHRLFRTAEQVTLFVTACGAGQDVDVWRAAWQRAKKTGAHAQKGVGLRPPRRKPPWKP